MRARRNRDLVEDLAGRREGFNEYGFLVRNVLRNRVQIRVGQGQPFGVRARVAANAEDGALRAVPPEPSGALVASAAREVDLAGDAAAEKRG